MKVKKKDFPGKIRPSGFTLIEILVVITIIALLASMAIVSYNSLNKNSRDARRRGDIEQLRVAIEQYRSNNNAYPTPAGTYGLSFGSGSLTDDSTTTYMSQLPQDPKSPQTYYYTGSTSDYTLGARLENISTCTAITVDCDTSSTVQNCNYCMGPYGQKP